MRIAALHLIDPELLDVVEAFAAVDISAANIQTLREAWRNPVLSNLSEGPPRSSVTLAMRSIPGPQGAPEVDVRIYRPKSVTEDLACIVHMHGGGYIGGDASSMEHVHRALSHELNCVVFSINYRLAPETCFPGNIEDCYAALTWLFSEAATLGIDSTRIGLMGESAGGGLAAALALLVRDRAEVSVVFQHLIYPMLDDRTCISRSLSPFTGEICWTQQNNYYGWAALLGKPPGSNDVSPYAAPARASTLAGLPPTFIAAATLDLFVEEDIAYASRLIHEGVAVELHVYPGAFHGFDVHSRATIARVARRDSLSALTRGLQKSM